MYWTRAVLKGAAKAELKIAFWKTIGVIVVSSVIASGISGIVSNVVGGVFSLTFYGNAFSIYALEDLAYGYPTPYVIRTIIQLVVMFAVMIGISLAVSFFASNPLEVGECNYFIRAPYGDRNFTHLFFFFHNGQCYWSIVKAMILRSVYIFLWTLLPMGIMVIAMVALAMEFWGVGALLFLSAFACFIPVYAKTYQYAMVPYILSENNSLTAKEALQISTEMTRGERLNMFILELSFIGWYLVAVFGGMLLMIIPILGWILFIPVIFGGTLAVTAYQKCTFAQLYFALRYKYFAISGHQGSDAGYYRPDNQYGPDYQQQAPPEVRDSDNTGIYNEVDKENRISPNLPSEDKAHKKTQEEQEEDPWLSDHDRES